VECYSAKENGGSPIICIHMDRCERHHVEWDKPGTEDKYYSLYKKPTEVDPGSFKGRESDLLSSVTPETFLGSKSHTWVILIAPGKSNNHHHIRCR
jgi:hypothetical protein